MKYKIVFEKSEGIASPYNFRETFFNQFCSVKAAEKAFLNEYGCSIKEVNWRLFAVHIAGRYRVVAL
jgi:hypothetical protein